MSESDSCIYPLAPEWGIVVGSVVCPKLGGTRPNTRMIYSGSLRSFVGRVSMLVIYLPPDKEEACLTKEIYVDAYSQIKRNMGCNIFRLEFVAHNFICEKSDSITKGYRLVHILDRSVQEARTLSRVDGEDTGGFVSCPVYIIFLAEFEQVWNQNKIDKYLLDTSERRWKEYMFAAVRECNPEKIFDASDGLDKCSKSGDKEYKDLGVTTHTRNDNQMVLMDYAWGVRSDPLKPWVAVQTVYIPDEVGIRSKTRTVENMVCFSRVRMFEITEYIERGRDLIDRCLPFDSPHFLIPGFAFHKKLIRTAPFQFTCLRTLVRFVDNLEILSEITASFQVQGNFSQANEMLSQPLSPDKPFTRTKIPRRTWILDLSLWQSELYAQQDKYQHALGVMENVEFALPHTPAIQRRIAELQIIRRCPDAALMRMVRACMLLSRITDKETQKKFCYEMALVLNIYWRASVRTNTIPYTYYSECTMLAMYISAFHPCTKREQRLYARQILAHISTVIKIYQVGDDGGKQVKTGTSLVEVSLNPLRKSFEIISCFEGYVYNVEHIGSVCAECLGGWRMISIGNGAFCLVSVTASNEVDFISEPFSVEGPSGDWTLFLRVEPGDNIFLDLRDKESDNALIATRKVHDRENLSKFEWKSHLSEKERLEHGYCPLQWVSIPSRLDEVFQTLCYIYIGGKKQNIERKKMSNT